MSRYIKAGVRERALQMGLPRQDFHEQGPVWKPLSVQRWGKYDEAGREVGSQLMEKGKWKRSDR